MTAKVVDGHRHVMSLDAHQLANQMDPVRANSMAGISQASASANVLGSNLATILKL